MKTASGTVPRQLRSIRDAQPAAPALTRAQRLVTLLESAWAFTGRSNLHAIVTITAALSLARGLSALGELVLPSLLNTFYVMLVVVAIAKGIQIGYRKVRARLRRS